MTARLARLFSTLAVTAAFAALWCAAPAHAQLGTWDAWNENSILETGPHAANINNGGFFVGTDTQGAFRIMASGSTIFDDFGPGDTYQTGLGWTISDVSSNVGLTVEQGDAFTVPVGAGFTLDSVTIAFQHVEPDSFGGPNQGIVTLRDDAGGLPGAILETWNLTGLPAFGSGDPPTVLASVGTPLTAGATYWVIASVAPTAVPEPTSLGFLAGGVVGLIAIRHRRRA